MAQLNDVQNKKMKPFIHTLKSSWPNDNLRQCIILWNEFLTKKYLKGNKVCLNCVKYAMVHKQNICHPKFLVYLNQHL